MDDENCVLFDAFANEEDDRHRLMAFLKDQDVKVVGAIHNQPFMLEPSKSEAHKSKLREKLSREQKLMDLKEKVRILVETPLYLNSDLIENDLVWSIQDQ